MAIYIEKTSKVHISENRLGVSRWYVSYSWGHHPVVSCLAVFGVGACSVGGLHVALRYMWLDVSLRGLGRVCGGMLNPCGGLRVGFSCRYPVCGVLLCRYVPWCRESHYHSHLV